MKSGNRERNRISGIQKIFFILILLPMISGLVGCDAFVRKFTRKPKKENIPREEMVLMPEEYKSNLTKEEQYRQYFLYWKSWHDELIESLSRTAANHKKQVDCTQEAINNLSNLRGLLNAETRKKLDAYINQLTDLKGLIVKDLYSSDAANNLQKAERIKRAILRDFSYDKIKSNLI